ncbi:MAG: hypothetical protein KGZ49_10550, partial [Syntrophaceae bacterium]|nr:hypothetical protein [Syntrophaceae bacterium]
NLSLRNGNESNDNKRFWIPAFAGMTFLEERYRFILHDRNKGSAMRLKNDLYSRYPFRTEGGKYEDVN